MHNNAYIQKHNAQKSDMGWTELSTASCRWGRSTPASCPASPWRRRGKTSTQSVAALRWVKFWISKTPSGFLHRLTCDFHHRPCGWHRAQGSRRPEIAAPHTRKYFYLCWTLWLCIIPIWTSKWTFMYLPKWITPARLLSTPPYLATDGQPIRLFQYGQYKKSIYQWR